MSKQNASFAQQVLDRSKRELQSMQDRLDKDAFVKVLRERVAENPQYSTRDLLDDLRRSTKIRNIALGIPLLELTNVLSGVTSVVAGKRSQQQTQAFVVRGRIRQFFESHPGEEFAVDTVATRLSIEDSQVVSTQIRSLMVQNVLVHANSGRKYRLNTAPAREFLMENLRNGNTCKIDVLKARADRKNIPYITQTAKMLAEIGTLEDLGNGQYRLNLPKVD